MPFVNLKAYRTLCGKACLFILYYILQYFWTNFNSFLKKFYEIHKKVTKSLLKITPGCEKARFYIQKKGKE